MKKSGTVASASGITVQVVQFGSDAITLNLPVDSTVAFALATAGVSRGTSGVFVLGETANDTDILDNGDIVTIVSSKQAGAVAEADGEEAEEA